MPDPRSRRILRGMPARARPSILSRAARHLHRRIWTHGLLLAAGAALASGVLPAAAPERPAAGAPAAGGEPGASGARSAAADPEAEFRADREWLLQRLARAAGIDPPGAAFPSYRVYADLVEKGARTGSTRPVAGPDAGGTIRRVARLPCSALDGEAEAAWLLRRAWGVEPAPVWSTGLAAAAAGRVYGRPPEVLAAALASAGLLPSIEEVLDPPPAIAQYPTLLAPAAHRLVRWVLARHGSRGLRAAVSATSRRGQRLRALAEALGESESSLREAYSGGSASPPAPPPRRAPGSAPAGFQRGVCYAHTVSLERGYASRRSALTLDRLERLRVNWISVTPFGYIELHAPEIAASSTFGSDAETDESLAEVVAQARARGLGILVKPHLWSTDFVGRIAMRGEADWRRFFRAYERYLAHHAVLAEACGASALCVGNEMIEATRGRDKEWRGLIGSARRLFSGPLTYGAHWEEEVGRIGFWDALDWVGVSLYAPLATDPAAGPGAWEGAARRQAERLGRIAQRAGKPLVLVEVGFPSHPRALLAPWEDPDTGPADDRVQAAAFEAVVSAFGPQPFLGGIYWWKWFTDDGASAGDRSHRFAGKPAEEVVRRFYGGR